MLLHDRWAADVDFLDSTGGFHLFELLSIRVLVHSLANWLSNFFAFFDLADSTVVHEQVLQVVLLTELNKNINKLEPHGFFLTREGSVKFKRKVCQIKRFWASVMSLLSIQVNDLGLVHGRRHTLSASNIRRRLTLESSLSLGSLTMIQSTSGRWTSHRVRLIHGVTIHSVWCALALSAPRRFNIETTILLSNS